MDNKYNLKNPEIIEGLENELQFIIDSDNERKAEDFYFYLERILNFPHIKGELSKDLLELYSRMIIKAKFIALPRMDKKEIYDLISNHFNKIFGLELYNIEEKIRKYLSFEYSLEERDRIKSQLRKILSESQIRITKEKIKIGDKQESPTIGNWLKDFRSRFKEEGFLNFMNLSQYFANNPSFLNLSDEEKENVKILFNFYRNLKFSSFTKEGLEEKVPIVTPNGEIGAINRGQREMIDKYTKEVYQKVAKALGKEIFVKDIVSKDRIDEFRKIASEYPAGSLERKAIEEEISRIQTKGENKEIR